VVGVVSESCSAIFLYICHSERIVSLDEVNSRLLLVAISGLEYEICYS
jgi:hypothetical protein